MLRMINGKVMPTRVLVAGLARFGLVIDLAQ
jgi:hypothetical protein